MRRADRGCARHRLRRGLSGLRLSLREQRFRRRLPQREISFSSARARKLIASWVTRVRPDASQNAMAYRLCPARRRALPTARGRRASPRRSGFRCCSRHPAAGAGGGCALWPRACSSLLLFAQASAEAAALRQSGDLSGTLFAACGTSRFKSSATGAAMPFICGSAIAASSAAIRSWSRRRRRLCWTQRASGDGGSCLSRCPAILKYEGAGTIEFIYDLDSGRWFFIEMNTTHPGRASGHRGNLRCRSRRRAVADCGRRADLVPAAGAAERPLRHRVPHQCGRSGQQFSTVARHGVRNGGRRAGKAFASTAMCTRTTRAAVLQLAARQADHQRNSRNRCWRQPPPRLPASTSPAFPPRFPFMRD